MDGGPVAAVVRLPDFDKNFSRLTKVVERLETPITWMLWGIAFASSGVALYFIRSSMPSYSSESKRDRDREKDRKREKSKENKGKDKDKESVEV